MPLGRTIAAARCNPPTQGPLHAEQLVGTWRLDSIYEENAAGEEIDTFGGNPEGYLVLDKSGHFSLEVLGSPRANDKQFGILIEQPATAAIARMRFQMSELANRCQVIEGDFFLPSQPDTTRTFCRMFCTIGMTGNVPRSCETAGGLSHRAAGCSL